MSRSHQRVPHDLNAYLTTVVTRIRSTFPRTRRIILFGSRAYGRPHDESDIDLFVELPTHQRPPTRYRAISQLLNPRPCGIDLIVKTPAEVKRIVRDFNPCFEDIFRKGRVLYAKTR